MERLLRIMLGGSGGQGIVTLGKVLSYAGMRRNMEVSCLPSYGAEMRGGYVYSTVVLSGGNTLLSPVISRADLGIFMNEASLAMLGRRVRRAGFVLVNSSLVARPPGRPRVFEVPATTTADAMGEVQAANMVMAGAAARIISRWFFPLSLDDVGAGICESVGARYRQLSAAAAAKGWALLEEAVETAPAAGTV